MPKCVLKSTASSPMVIPWRMGMGKSPTNDSNPGSSIGPSTAAPPIGLGRSHTIDRERVPGRGAQAVGHRVDERVDARADILQIDDQDVEPAQHLGRRLARFAVEGVDRHPPYRVGRVRRLDHVVLQVRAEPVLRAEQRGQRHPRRAEDEIGGVRERRVHRGRVADEPGAKPFEPARGQQPRQSWYDTHAADYTKPPARRTPAGSPEPWRRRPTRLGVVYAAAR